MVSALIPAVAFLSESHLSTCPERRMNRCDSPIVPLFLAKRRGNLGSIVDAGETVARTTRTVPKKRSKRISKKSTSGSSSSGGSSSSSTKKSGKDATSSLISPLLQEWASQGEDDEDANEDEIMAIETKSKISEKNVKKSSSKSSKQVQDEERKALVESLVQQIQDVLEESSENNKKTTDMDALLGPIQQLLALPNANTNLRQLIAGSTRHDYRLTWVGSDAAVCHIGTGLHNVPLARLQEIFLSLIGKSRLEVLEVIRIIGPFPNVRNTLEGSCSIGKRGLVYGTSSSSSSTSSSGSNGLEQTVTQLGVTYDSMIDGTGKQITAGVMDNVRKLEVHIAYCDENVIVAVVPPEDGGVRKDPLENNGANILFFCKEEELDEKLDALRVL